MLAQPEGCQQATALAVMLPYNLLVTAYLASLGFDGAMVRVLLGQPL